MKLGTAELKTIELARTALHQFTVTFGRKLSTESMVELYVALELGLDVAETINQPGHDLTGSDGTRYQVKYRDTHVNSVDLTNFDFEFLVLVNLSDEYRPSGMWKLPVADVEELFTLREGKTYRRYQATQQRVKERAVRLSLKQSMELTGTPD